MPAPAAKTPCYAVIFASRRKAGDAGYAAAADELVRLAEAAPGFLGAQSVRDATGEGITVSWWASLEDIERFRNHPRHVEVRRRMADWYADWSLRVCKLERGLDWSVPAARD